MPYNKTELIVGDRATAAELANDIAEVGSVLGTTGSKEPDNTFPPRSSNSRWAIRQIPSGMVPEMELLLKMRVVRLPILPRDEGNVPSSILLASTKTSKAENEERKDGMLPEMRLPAMTSWSKCVRFCIEGGIFPVRFMAIRFKPTIAQSGPDVCWTEAQDNPCHPLLQGASKLEGKDQWVATGASGSHLHHSPRVSSKMLNSAEYSTFEIEPVQVIFFPITWNRTSDK